MSDTVLTPDELEHLTGYKRPGQQLDYLRDKLKIQPFVSRTGAITVFRSVLLEAQRVRSGLEIDKHAKKGAKPRLERVK